RGPSRGLGGVTGRAHADADESAALVDPAAQRSIGAASIGTMVNRRVVVTGIGLVSSLGIGTEANWQALTAGQSGIGRITKFDASEFSTQIAGEVKGFDPLRFIEKKDVKKMDVF